MPEPRRVDFTPRMIKAPTRRQIATKVMATVAAVNEHTKGFDALMTQLETAQQDIEQLNAWRARGFRGRLRWLLKGK